MATREDEYGSCREASTRRFDSLTQLPRCQVGLPADLGLKPLYTSHRAASLPPFFASSSKIRRVEMSDEWPSRAACTRHAGGGRCTAGSGPRSTAHWFGSCDTPLKAAFSSTARSASAVMPTRCWQRVPKPS